MMTDQEFKEHIDSIFKGPRITPDDVESQIVGEHYFTAFDGVLGALSEGDYKGSALLHGHDVAFKTAVEATHLPLLTFCVLVLRNGYTVTAHSACASPENFIAQMGRDIARNEAVKKIWPLLGYELCSKLSVASN